MANFDKWAAALLLFAWPAAGWAQDSDYCRKVRARAAGDAALLFSPSLQAQGLKFPSSGSVDAGVTNGVGYQLRAAVSFSPLDWYRGARVLRVGAADCRQHEVVVAAQELLLQGDELGHAGALREQAAFLEGHRVAWEEIAAKSDERLAAHVTSLVDALEVRARRAELERKRAQVAGELERIDARGAVEASPPRALAEAVDRSAMRYEREVSHLRTLDAWNVSVSGGLVPQGGSVDWFGIVQVSFNVGGVLRVLDERRYLRARAAELEGARYEVHDQLRRLAARIASARAQAERELAIVAEQLASLGANRDALQHADAPNAPHALALVELTIIDLESDRVFLAALARELTRLQENAHDR